MNLLFVREISEWGYEQDNYVSYDPDSDDEAIYSCYRNQSLERAAESFTNEWWLDYWEYIQGIEPLK